MFETIAYMDEFNDVRIRLSSIEDRDTIAVTIKHSMFNSFNEAFTVPCAEMLKKIAEGIYGED